MDCQIDPLKANILRKGNNLSNIVCPVVVAEIDFEMITPSNLRRP